MTDSFDKRVDRRKLLAAGAATFGAMAAASCGGGKPADEDAGKNGTDTPPGNNSDHTTKILSRDAVVPAKDLPPGKNLPSKAIIRKIDMPKNSKTLDIQFSTGYAAITLSKTVTIESILKKLSAKVDPSAKIADPYPVGEGLLKDVSSPISLDLEGDAYVIYVLDDTTSWQFCTTGSPFSIENIKDASGKMKPDFYALPRRWGKKSPDDTTEVDQSHENDASLKECKIAYMVALSAGRGDYIDRFNIHLELIVQNKWNKVPILVPIILDPDIRHPGGSMG